VKEGVGYMLNYRGRFYGKSMEYIHPTGGGRGLRPSPVNAVEAKSYYFSAFGRCEITSDPVSLTPQASLMFFILLRYLVKRFPTSAC
jgi:hypothetical protein